MTRAEAMRQARLNAGLTVRELARRTGVTPKTVSAIETGAREGNITTIELMADALSIPIDQYIGREVNGYMEYRVKYDHNSEMYIVYANGKEIGRAFDVKGIGDIIHIFESKN